MYIKKRGSNTLTLLIFFYIQIYKLPIFFIDNNSKILFKFTYESIENPLISIKETVKPLLPFDTFSKTPKILSTKYNENFFYITLIENNLYLRIFVVGPSIFSLFYETLVENFLDSNKLSLSYKKPLLNYFKL